MRLSVFEVVKEIEAEAECVCEVDTVPEGVGDNEEESVDEWVLLSVFDADCDSDDVAELLTVAVGESLAVPVPVSVRERVADRLTEGLRDADADEESDSDAVAEAVPEREIVADSERVTLPLVDTLRLGVALSVRQLRPP